MKHFLNQDLLALNVTTVPVDVGIVAEFGKLEHRDSPGFESVFPKWNGDLEWRSPSTPATHRIFESAFERLGIANHMACYLDIDKEVRLYAGFLVIRSYCAAPHFHVDWDRTNNEAFTLLTPISANAHAFGLIYEKLNGEIGEYEYKIGEAIVFGDRFRHSTKPGKSEEPVVLLCFEFGSDKMQHWEKICPNIERQAGMLRRPDGEFVRTDLSGGAGY